MINKETQSQKRKRIEVEASREYIQECLYNLSDKKIVWLAEKCLEIDNYGKRSLTSS